MPIGSYTDSIVVTGARERIRKKILVRAARYRQDPFEAAYNKVRSNPTWSTFELTCGHHAIVDMPELGGMLAASASTGPPDTASPDASTTSPSNPMLQAARNRPGPIS
jgi:hypothetical protein